MCDTLRILGIMLLFMGLGMIIGIIAPCSTFWLGAGFIAAGLITVLN